MIVCLSADNKATCKCNSKTSENFRDVIDIIGFFSKALIKILKDAIWIP